MPQNTHSTASFSVSVYPAQALRVCNGANFGDALSVAGDLMPDDVYALSSPAALLRLSLTADAADGALSIAADTGTGSNNQTGFWFCQGLPPINPTPYRR